jgi:O-succinylbenzoic acid--CoA ligase
VSDRDGRAAADAWEFTDWADRRSRLSPERTAVVDTGTGTSLTYAALDERVQRTAGRLAALGVAPGDHLGALVGTRVAAVVLVHAAARLGVTLVPVDPRGGPAAVRDRLDGADASAVVCEAPTERTALTALDGGDGHGDAALALPLASVDATDRGAVTELATVAPASVRPAEWGLDDRLLVLYTSGTTGDPKPVQLTAGNVLASATSSALRLGVLPGDRWLCELPAYHMGGIAPFYRTAVYGTTAVVHEREPLAAPAESDEPTGRDGFDAAGTLRALHEHAATGVSLVPTQLRRLLEAADAAGADEPDGLPASLRFVLLGGGPAPERLIERCDRRDVPVCPTYGLTETASQVTTARPEEATERVGTVGRPLAFTDVVVARPTDGESAERAGADTPAGFRRPAPGEVGEVFVRGPTVTPGYYGRPAVTAERFVDGWLRTGDRGRLVDGRLFVAGRRADRIVTGGENVDPETVADAVRSVAGVRSVAVVGVPDEEWGEAVAALVVRAADAADRDAAAAEPSRETVLSACRERLPGHAVPRTVRFVAELPRTTSGTVDRDAARELLTEVE